MILASNKAELLRQAIEIKETCRVSAPQRAALCRLQNMWVETGRPSGTRALVNKLYSHIDRLQSHLYSPAELRFVLDYEAHYPAEVLAQGEVAARVLTREWERKDIDVQFGNAVNLGLQYGACIMKQMWGHSGVEARVIQPWQFGVYREDVTSIEEQEALCESGLMTLPEVWRRISHLPDAQALYTRIRAHASKNSGETLNSSFFHNVLSTSILNTDLATARQQPGGIVQLSGDSSMSMVGPEINIDLVPFHEMWVKDDDREDYTTILLIEPDIIVSPYFKRENMFAPKTQPFSLVQPNQMPGYFWGRSEIIDLMEPQGLLAQWMDDLKRLMGVQFDKILAFTGADGITDEKYAEFRAAGFVDLPAGASVNDLTPPLPPQTFQAIDTLNKFMEEISGFSNILSGQGEMGVRSGNHAETLSKMASPRLRDRSLLVERQAAAMADKTLDLLQAKDGQQYMTESGKGFVLHDLPEDRRVTVDSHSSSPIFADNHQQLIAFGLKSGFVGGDSAIEMLPYPQKDILKQRYKAMQEAKQKLIQEHPEVLTKGKGHK
jgi:hypothetical protein